MDKKEFNELTLAERSKLVFEEGKLMDIFEDNTLQKIFFFKLNDLKIDVIYDKTRNRLLDIIAWENSTERIPFLRMSA
ncbi:MAG: hypothetical protein ACLQQ4_05015 [Bacteroidia bacterium]|jgi:hypothetical protein